MTRKRRPLNPKRVLLAQSRKNRQESFHRADMTVRMAGVARPGVRAGMLGTVDMADTFCPWQLRLPRAAKQKAEDRISAPSGGGGSLSEKYCGCRAASRLPVSAARRVVFAAAPSTRFVIFLFRNSPASGVKAGTLLVRRFGRRVPLRFPFSSSKLRRRRLGCPLSNTSLIAWPVAKDPVFQLNAGAAE
jgi:hypothetical protein